MSGIAAVILAAGRGTRFGSEPKLLALLDGKPLVRRVAEAAAASSLDPVILVTGHRAGEVEAAVAGLRVRIVPNPDFAEGLSTSLRAGFSALPDDARAGMVLLADMPRVTASLIDRLASAWHEAGGPDALVPTYEGRRGNPAVLSTALRGSITSLTGDTGAGPLLRGRADVLEYDLGNPAVLQDVDTGEALAALVDRSGQGRLSL